MWKVRRRWLPHRDGIGVHARFRGVTRRLRKKHTRDTSTTSSTRTKKDRWYDGWDIGDACLDPDALALMLLAIIGIVLVAFVLPPLLLVGIDLLWLLLVFVLGIIGRFLLGRPWNVEAVHTGGERRVWQVKGMRGAGQLRDTLQVEFDAGLDPRPDDFGGSISSG